jgi:hypothetical protein
VVAQHSDEITSRNGTHSSILGRQQQRVRNQPHECEQEAERDGQGQQIAHLMPLSPYRLLEKKNLLKKKTHINLPSSQ